MRCGRSIGRSVGPRRVLLLECVGVDTAGLESTNIPAQGWLNNPCTYDSTYSDTQSVQNMIVVIIRSNIFPHHSFHSDLLFKLISTSRPKNKTEFRNSHRHSAYHFQRVKLVGRLNKNSILNVTVVRRASLLTGSHEPASLLLSAFRVLFVYLSPFILLHNASV